MWGDDFSHVYANNTYDIMDRIIAEMDIDSSFKDRNYTISYSSVQQFFDDVFNDAKKNTTALPEFKGDLWEYNQNTDPGFWTGYYTQFPEFKKSVYDYSDHVHSSSLLTNLELFNKTDWSESRLPPDEKTRFEQ